jgi:S-formylglutathione hydrolase FrmB
MKRFIWICCLTLLPFIGHCEAEAPVKEMIEADGCTIEKYSIFSPSMKRDIRIIVVLPPAYKSSPDQKFPILHTLHGYGAPYDTWSQMTTLRQTLKDCPMIVTCLDGDKGSWYLDSPIKPESQFETFFFDEFIPYLDKTYRVDTTRRAVTGFSMGGAGAFHYMLKKPELFKSVSSLSGAFYHLADSAGKKHESLQGLIGTYHEYPERYKELDQYKRIEKTATLPPIYLHCGTEDYLLSGNREMSSFLKAKGFRVEYKESAGAHNWPFWKAAAPDVIKFHWENGLAPAAD